MDIFNEGTSFFSRFFGVTEIREWSENLPDFRSGQRLKTYPRLTKHQLPNPVLPYGCSLPEALLGRNSAQKFMPQEFTLAEVSIFLASVGARPEIIYPGITGRTYPSAGAKYPGETYLITLNCETLPLGLYHYSLHNHALEELWTQDLREQLVLATKDERVLSASIILIFSIVYGRIAEKYGERGLRYALIELGHMAQNISLTAFALGKGCYEMGGFIDSIINTWLDIDMESETAVLLMAIGGNDGSLSQ